MKLEIISPTGVLFEGEIDCISLPGTMGSFEILPDHAPIIAALQQGIIEYGNGKQRAELSIQSGFVEVKSNLITVCIE